MGGGKVKRDPETASEPRRGPRWVALPVPILFLFVMAAPLVSADTTVDPWEQVFPPNPYPTPTSGPVPPFPQPPPHPSPQGLVPWAAEWLRRIVFEYAWDFASSTADQASGAQPPKPVPPDRDGGEEAGDEGGARNQAFMPSPGYQPSGGGRTPASYLEALGRDPRAWSGAPLADGVGTPAGQPGPGPGASADPSCREPAPEVAAAEAVAVPQADDRLERVIDSAVNPKPDSNPAPCAPGVAADAVGTRRSASAWAAIGVLPPRLSAVVAVAVLGGAVAVLLQLLWGLFSRLAPDRALDHPRRNQILGCVERHPGIHVLEVARILGLSRSSTRHHVGQLAALGQLLVKSFNGRTSLFPSDLGHPAAHPGFALLRKPTYERVYRLLKGRPGLDQLEIAHEVGLTRQRVSQLLKRMETAHLAQSERGGLPRRYASLTLPAEPEPRSRRPPDAAPS